MAVAMAEVVLKAVALVLERVEGLILDLPPAARHAGEIRRVLPVDVQIRDPCELPLARTAFEGALATLQHGHQPPLSDDMRIDLVSDTKTDLPRQCIIRWSAGEIPVGLRPPSISPAGLDGDGSCHGLRSPPEFG